MEGFDDTVEILIFKYLQQSMSPEDADMLKRWITASPGNRVLFEKLTDEKYINEELGKMCDYDAEKGWAVVEDRFSFSRVAVETPLATDRGVSKVYLARYFPAAVILLVLAWGLFLLTTKKKPVNYVKAGRQVEVMHTDVVPGNHKATLILGDGSKIILNDSGNGKLAEQGNANIVKYDGKLTYKLKDTGQKQIFYNTIFNPRGAKKYQVVLADGSAVWLNAESSIRFPTVFTTAERRVEIMGEAYFEVIANKTQPFIVSVRGAEVQVFGTHFNVMAYADEAQLATTLLEGLVYFKNGDASTRLKPGEQLRLNKLGQIKVAKEVNLGEVMAWKNEAFYFERADIETVMRQVARYYDVDVVYQGDKPKDLLHTDIPRNTSLSEVLKALELAGGIKCRIDGQKVIVI